MCEEGDGLHPAAVGQSLPPLALNAQKAFIINNLRA
jgi:hypothetical protein